MIVFLIIAVCLVLAGEFLYLRRYLRIALDFWGADQSKKPFVIGKYAFIALFMASTVMVFSVVGIGALHIFAIAAIMDLAYILVRLIIKKRVRALDFIVHSGIFPVLLGVGMMIYGYINMHTVVMTEYTVHTDKTLDRDYKVAFVSDMHIGVSLDLEDFQEMCDEISAQSPDVLLLGGDIIDESTPFSDLVAVFGMLGKVKARYGVYYVYGNHDYPSRSINSRDYTQNELENVITSSGITILTDDIVSIGSHLAIVGRRDSSFKGDDRINERVSISDLMKGTSKDKFILVLDHQPREYDNCKALGVDLIISGHTHGGQIWPAGLVTTLLAPNEMDYGHKEDDGFNAIVSSGVAGWSFPVKTSKYAEYLIITLTNN